VSEADQQKFRDGFHRVKIVQETEKAVAVPVVIDAPGGFSDTQLIWFAKSQIGGADGIAIIPGWLIRERESTAPLSWKPRSRYARDKFAAGWKPKLQRGVEILESLEAGKAGSDGPSKEN
jgi:hypothetical protein